MTNRCNDVVKLQHRLAQGGARDDDGSLQGETLQNQGFSVFGAKPITCEVAKAAASSSSSSSAAAAAEISAPKSSAARSSLSRPSPSGGEHARTARQLVDIDDRGNSDGDGDGDGYGDGDSHVRDDHDSDADWQNDSARNCDGAAFVSRGRGSCAHGPDVLRDV
jgi:hypothetical protein